MYELAKSRTFAKREIDMASTPGQLSGAGDAEHQCCWHTPPNRSRGFGSKNWLIQELIFAARLGVTVVSKRVHTILTYLDGLVQESVKR